MGFETVTNYWVVRNQRGEVLGVVFGETTDDARNAANEEFDRNGGYVMRRLAEGELSRYGIER